MLINVYLSVVNASLQAASLDQGVPWYFLDPIANGDFVPRLPVSLNDPHAAFPILA